MKWPKIVNLIHAYLDLLLKREKPHAHPVELSLGTTSFCNLKCIMCPREDNQGNRMPYDEHLGMDYYTEFRPYFKSAKEVSLYGLGEPMIDRGYFEKVRYVSSFGAEVSLSTNGTLMDETRCRELVASGVKAIGISLDASTDETFVVVRPPGGLQKIVNNIKCLTRIKMETGSALPYLKLSFGIMRQNLHDLPAFPDLAAEVGCQELVIHPVIFMSEPMKNTVSVDRNEMLEAVNQARTCAERHGIVFSFWDLDPMTYLKSLKYAEERNNHRATPPASNNGKGKPHFCFFLWRNAMVQGQGELFPCCYMTNIQLGTVQNGNLRELRGHPFLADMRKKLFAGDLPAPCASCPQLQPYNRLHILKSAFQELRNVLSR